MIGDLGEYARAIWEAHVERRGSDFPLMTSAEFDLVRTWHRDGIPLRVVLRGLEDTKGRKSSLSYYGPSVAEAAAYWRRALA